MNDAGQSLLVEHVHSAMNDGLVAVCVCFVAQFIYVFHVPSFFFSSSEFSIELNLKERNIPNKNKPKSENTSPALKRKHITIVNKKGRQSSDTKITTTTTKGETSQSRVTRKS